MLNVATIGGRPECIGSVVAAEPGHTHLTSDFHLQAMAPQDRKKTEENARTLRELLKYPDNKICADCKRPGASTSCPAQDHVSPTRVASSTLGFVESVSSATNGSSTYLISLLQRRVSVHPMRWYSQVHGDKHQQG